MQVALSLDCKIGINLKRILNLICITGIDLSCNSNLLLLTKILFPLGVKKTFSMIFPSLITIRIICPENLP